MRSIYFKNLYLWENYFSWNISIPNSSGNTLRRNCPQIQSQFIDFFWNVELSIAKHLYNYITFSSRNLHANITDRLTYSCRWSRFRSVENIGISGIRTGRLGSHPGCISSQVLPWLIPQQWNPISRLSTVRQGQRFLSGSWSGRERTEKGGFEARRGGFRSVIKNGPIRARATVVNPPPMSPWGQLENDFFSHVETLWNSKYVGWASPRGYRQSREFLRSTSGIVTSEF